MQPEIFQGRGGFVELGHFDKHFVKNTRKKVPLEKILEFFLLDTLKTTFWMENWTQRWKQSGPFFPKSGALLLIFKKGLSLSPSCTPAILTKHLIITNLSNHSKKQPKQLPRTILQRLVFVKKALLDISQAAFWVGILNNTYEGVQFL